MTKRIEMLRNYLSGKVLPHQGQVGFGARTKDEWVDALTTLLAEPGTAQQLGKNGRAVVDANFSVQVLSSRLAEIIRTVAD
jgi:glycosyltransferase involved in cell wall biosynthesis